MRLWCCGCTGMVARCDVPLVADGTEAHGSRNTTHAGSYALRADLPCGRPFPVRTDVAVQGV